MVSRMNKNSEGIDAYIIIKGGIVYYEHTFQNCGERLFLTLNIKNT